MRVVHDIEMASGGLSTDTPTVGSIRYFHIVFWSQSHQLMTLNHHQRLL